MSWITLTEAHVKARLATAELEEIEEAGEVESTDRLAGILTQVTALVRGKVLTCDENLAKVGDSGTIPEECLWAAATIARDSLVASLPVAESETSPRQEETRKAHSILDQVASCKLRIEGPSGSLPEAEDGGAGEYGGAELLGF